MLAWMEIQIYRTIGPFERENETLDALMAKNGTHGRSKETHRKGREELDNDELIMVTRKRSHSEQKSDAFRQDCEI